MKRTAIFVGLSLLLNGAGLLAADASELAGKLPMESIADSQKVLGEIVKLGPGAIKDLCKKLAMPGLGDTKAEFALNGLALHVVRPGAEDERKMVAGALLEVLEAEQRPEVKPLLIQLIQYCGKDEAVSGLARQFAAGPVLCDHAARALVSIGSPAAVKAVAQTLADAKDKCRASILGALGDLAKAGKIKALPKDVEAAVVKDAADGDAAIRYSAWRVLAFAGSIDAAADALAKAADSTNSHDKAVGTAEYLTLVRRMTDKAKAAAICRDLIKSRRQAGYKAAAAAALVDIVGAEANDDLLALGDSPSLDIRTSAQVLAARLPGEAVTAKWAAKLATGEGPAKVEIVWMLGKRGDGAAVPAVAAAAKDKDDALRAAAIDALGQLKASKPAEAVAALVGVLSAGQMEDVKHAQVVLSRLAGDDVSKAIAQAAAAAKGDAKVAMLEILAARRSGEGADVILAAMKDSYAPARAAAVKALGELADFSAAPKLVALLMESKEAGEQAAIQKALINVCARQADVQKRGEPVLAALADADGARKVTLLRVLGKVGGDKALQAVVAETQSSDADTQDAAVRALCDWPDAAAVPALLNLAKSAAKPAQQVLALRGLTRIAGDLAATEADKATEIFASALAAAKRPDDKRAILSGLTKVRTLEALKLAVSQTDDAGVAAEAAQAAADIALPNAKKRGDKGIQDPQAAQLLRKAATAVKDPAVKDKLTKHAEAIEKK